MEEYTLEWVLTRDEKFRYQLLDRMRSDCAYYVGNGRIYGGNHLWAGNIKDQIAIRKGIWNSFPADGKPEWLTWEQIEAYEAEMEAIPHRDQ